MKCGVCGRKWPDERCQSIRLTESEKAIIQRQTGEPAPDKYIYCGPCWRLFQNKQQGAQFISGSMRAALHAVGHPQADAASKKMLAFLLAKSSKPMS